MCKELWSAFHGVLLDCETGVTSLRYFMLVSLNLGLRLTAVPTIELWVKQ